MLLVGVTVAFPYPQDAAVPADVVAPVDGGPAPGEEKVDERFFLLRPSYGGHGHGHGHHHHGGYGGYGNQYNSKSSSPMDFRFHTFVRVFNIHRLHIV